MPEYFDDSFEIVRLDLAELKKKEGGIKKLQEFLIATDERTRVVAAKAGREDTNSAISLMEQVVFRNTKAIVLDVFSAFRSKKFERRAQRKGTKLRFPAPYRPEANALAEWVIQNIKQFMTSYPEFRGG